MKYNKLIPSLIFKLILLNIIIQDNTYAQVQELAYSGTGIICHEKNVNPLYINFPDAEFNLYSAPDNKSKFGIIYKKNSLNLMYKTNNSIVPFRVSGNDLAEIERYGYCLKIYDIKNGYFLILKNSFNKGLWINKNELGYFHYINIQWLQLFISLKQHFYSCVEVGINLREKPSPSSKKITLIKGDKYVIILTGNIEGLWAEVKVEKHSIPVCKNSGKAKNTPIESFNGWIKAIDDSGYSNICFYPHGCSDK